MKNWSANTNSPEILAPQQSLVLILKDGEREEKAHTRTALKQVFWSDGSKFKILGWNHRQLFHFIV